jgi:NadR type nicotinamide-nucleotide adenylyltransferase
MSPRRGFLLGKFMPPHAGHLHLIDEAAKRCDELTILVCTLARDPIPGDFRFRWMLELRGQHRLVHVTDEVPSYPEEHPRFWEIWEDLLRRVLPADVDVVFTSESYGDEIARRLDIQHVPIDPERTAVPVSATMIREDPFANWRWIPPPVRPWFVARVAVLGAESSGKSVLAAELAERFRTTFVQEYGREHTAPMKTVSEEIRPEDFLAIAAEHARRIDAAAGDANRILIVDTEALTTAVWSEWYLGSCAPDLWKWVDRQRLDHYLLLAPDLAWEDDGTREFPSRRVAFFHRLREELERRAWPYLLIEGDGAVRVERAVEALCQRWPSLRL